MLPHFFCQDLPQRKINLMPEKSDPLSLVKIAVNVASNTQHQDLNGFLAIYVDSESWAAALKDGDLGPFLKLKEVKPGRSAVLFFTPEKDTAITVFFDGNSPFGMTAAKAKSGKIEAGDISSAYKPVSKEMLKDAGQEPAVQQERCCHRRRPSPYCF